MATASVAARDGFEKNRKKVVDLVEKGSTIPHPQRWRRALDEAMSFGVSGVGDGCGLIGLGRVERWRSRLRNGDGGTT